MNFLNCSARNINQKKLGLKSDFKTHRFHYCSCLYCWLTCTCALVQNERG